MESKRVGIITIFFGSTNYGGCLQAYALVKVINDLGVDCEQILYDSDPGAGRTSIELLIYYYEEYGLKRVLQQVFLYGKRKIKTIQRKPTTTAQIAKRRKVMKAFRDTIPHSNKVYTQRTLHECDGYDVYICGSDQVWRVDWQKLNPGYWLTFVESPKKKISYAASISLKSIPDDKKESIKVALTSFDAISVREDEDRELLKEILSDEVVVEQVLDPVFLLSEDHWGKIAAKRIRMEERYIFAYLLNDRSVDRIIVKAFAEKKGLKLVTIPYVTDKYRICDDSFGDIHIQAPSPNQFLSMIKYADYVITDSFHAVAFSIIFKRQFFVFRRNSDFERNSMNSRVYSVLKKFNIEGRIIENGEIVENGKIDFHQSEQILSRERRKSISFISENV